MDRLSLRGWYRSYPSAAWRHSYRERRPETWQRRTCIFSGIRCIGATLGRHGAGRGHVGWFPLEPPPEVVFTKLVMGRTDVSGQRNPSSTTLILPADVTMKIVSFRNRAATIDGAFSGDYACDQRPRARCTVKRMFGRLDSWYLESNAPLELDLRVAIADYSRGADTTGVLKLAEEGSHPGRPHARADQPSRHLDSYPALELRKKSCRP